jgi:VIT1/CCC1 family predicted Fe2+/Mn2+ transporter
MVATTSGARREADTPPKRAPVLDPIDRASEIVFGVLMALSITGSVSVASAGRNELRTLLFTAIGCNLAWGLVDAVMYLVSAATERTRAVSLLKTLQSTRDPGEARRRIADALPERLAAGASDEALEALRVRMLSAPAPRAGLCAHDFRGALGVLVLVVSATFPVVVPFMLVDDPLVALRASNLLGLATLFASGFVLGRYAGGNSWRSGLAMVGVGTALMAVIIALGG